MVQWARALILQAWRWRPEFEYSAPMQKICLPGLWPHPTSGCGADKQILRARGPGSLAEKVNLQFSESRSQGNLMKSGRRGHLLWPLNAHSQAHTPGHVCAHVVPEYPCSGSHTWTCMCTSGLWMPMPRLIHLNIHVHIWPLNAHTPEYTCTSGLWMPTPRPIHWTHLYTPLPPSFISLSFIWHCFWQEFGSKHLFFYISCVFFLWYFKSFCL